MSTRKAVVAVAVLLTVGLAWAGQRAGQAGQNPHASGSGKPRAAWSQTEQGDAGTSCPGHAKHKRHHKRHQQQSGAAQQPAAPAKQ